MLLQPILLALLLVYAAAGGEWLEVEETEETFVEYPPEIQLLVDEEAQALLSESYNNGTGAHIPKLRAYTAFPEKSHNKWVWPLLKGLVRRFHPILGPHATIYIEDGRFFGCRTSDPVNRTTEIPVESAHCYIHCIRAGRYCLPFSSDDLPGKHPARDMLKEIVRRLCLVRHYHTKEQGFFGYLEKFHFNKCLESPSITECSIQSMKEVGLHHSSLHECLQEDAVDEDLALDVLESSVERLHQKGMHQLFKKNESALPQIEIDGQDILVKEPFERPFDSRMILEAFCNAFENPPLACQYCMQCFDVRTCLWMLQCDGRSIFGNGTHEVDPSQAISDGSIAQDYSEAFRTSEAAPSVSSQTHKSRGLSEIALFVVFGVVTTATGLALFLVYRQIRTKQLMAEVLNDLPTEDPLESKSVNIDDFYPRYYERGESCRRKKTTELTVAVGRDIDFIEKVSGSPSRAKVMEETFSVEDLWDEESEWAKKKRAGYPRTHSSVMC